MSPRSNIGPYLSRNTLIWLADGFNTANKRCEPSNGGIGIRLKSPNIRLIEPRQQETSLAYSQHQVFHCLISTSK